MPTSLDVPCFVYHGEACLAKLAIDEGLGSDLLVRCPLRQRLYVLTPEERVRQALIWFLVEGSNSALSWQDRLRFAAEQRSVDVSAWLRTETDEQKFAPKIPVVAVETKREEHDCIGDADVEQQLATYMRRERCRDGLLFNARGAAWVSCDGDFLHGRWLQERLSDLTEVEERILRATTVAAAYWQECRTAFRAASRGEFEALLRLVSLFGTDLGLTFVLSLRMRGSVGSVQAFALRAASGEAIAYRTRGVVSRNPQQLSRRDFHALVSIRPI